jgi:hypothetical protein
MQLELGYHVMSREAANERGEFDDQMSIVEFLRRLDQREDLPLDVTVYGLDDYLLSAADPDDACDHIHSLLRDRASHISLQQPCIQFVVDEIEYWDEPVIPAEDGDIGLSSIFRRIDKRGAGWYESELNVSS